jgi:hypothetical protein
MAAAVVVVGVGGVGVEDTTVAAMQWAIPLASAPSRSDRLARVCGGHCGYGKCWFPCPGVPPFNMALCERGPIETRMTGAPDQGAWWRSFHIGEITFLTPPAYHYYQVPNIALNGVRSNGQECLLSGLCGVVVACWWNKWCVSDLLRERMAERMNVKMKFLADWLSAKGLIKVEDNAWTRFRCRRTQPSNWFKPWECWYLGINPDETPGRSQGSNPGGQLAIRKSYQPGWIQFLENECKMGNGILQWPVRKDSGPRSS